MAKALNLSAQIQKQLPAGLAEFIREAGELAHSQGQSLYLVGGVVRDLMLGLATFDIDLVVEGDAISLARRLVPGLNEPKITTHSRFNTAKLKWDGWSVDIATARSETYARPGALPTVRPGPLKEDLFRRDFTINAMAICLVPGRYGELVDLYEGMADLERKLIRVLHEKSFTDDATRIWRALRYEQRLDFHLEDLTLKLLKRDIDMLDTISADRIRHELELVFKEKLPEKVLRRAGELGVMAKISPALKANDSIDERFERARQLYAPDLPPFGLHLPLLAYSLTEEQAEALVSCLRLPKSVAQTLRDTVAIREKLGQLARPGLKPSRIYSLLREYTPLAVTANIIAMADAPVSERLQLFLNKLRYVKPLVSGNDLEEMGVPHGPEVKEVLERLRSARLDGEVSSRQVEEALVKSWLSSR